MVDASMGDLVTNPEIIELAKRYIEENDTCDDGENVIALAEAVVRLSEENEELKKVVDQWPWDEKDGGWFIIKKKGIPAAAEEFLLEFKNQSQALKHAEAVIDYYIKKYGEDTFPGQWKAKYGTKK